jgi:hypothetical protein
MKLKRFYKKLVKGLSNNKGTPTSIRIHRYIKVITAVTMGECK